LVNLFLPLKSAKLVAVRITHVGKIHDALFSIAQTGRLVDRSSAKRHCGVTKLLHLLRGTATEKRLERSMPFVPTIT
jgi:hypothetical protein